MSVYANDINTVTSLECKVCLAISQFITDSLYDLNMPFDTEWEDKVMYGGISYTLFIYKILLIRARQSNAETLLLNLLLSLQTKLKNVICKVSETSTW